QGRRRQKRRAAAQKRVTLFGISWSELLLVLVVALVVIGPRDMPRLLYQAGKVFKKIRKFTGDIQASLEEIMHEEELEDITREANKPGGDNLQFEIDRQYEAEQARRRLAEADAASPQKAVNE